jgi:hypothetical protein
MLIRMEISRRIAYGNAIAAATLFCITQCKSPINVTGCVERPATYSIDSDLKLSLQQQHKYFGMGNSCNQEFVGPRNAWGGWGGPGQYKFHIERNTVLTTPYLADTMQLNDWNYLLFHEKRLSPNKLGHPPQPVDSEVKAAVDELFAERRKIHLRINSKQIAPISIRR